MSLFKKKLDYSQGSGVLPKLNPSEYSTLKFPNTSLLRVPNFSLMERERDQGNLEKAMGASADAYLDPKNDTQTREIIEKYLGPLCSRMAPNLSSDAVQVVGHLIGVGCGMALVEEKSGLLIPGKCHPSILNVIFRFITNMDEGQKSLFSKVPVFQQFLETAISVGYVGTRTKPTPEVQEMLSQVSAVSA
jgi:hypothetical protein